MSQTLLHDEHESLHPTQPPYVWPQEALMDCSHPPHTYDVPAGKGVAQRVGGGVTRSKLDPTEKIGVSAKDTEFGHREDRGLN